MARIKLTSTSLKLLDKACTEVMGIGRRSGVRVKGPTPLPVKKLHVATRKSPCGNGTETYEKWEMRMHRRIIDIGKDDKVLRQMARLNIPDEVHMEISLT